MYSVEILHEEMADVPSSMKQGIVRYSPADHNRLLFLKTYKLFTCGILPLNVFRLLDCKKKLWEVKLLRSNNFCNRCVHLKKSRTEMFH